MARRTIFNATFCCGNMLQQFEVDSNCCNIVARTLSQLVHVTPSPSTFNATLYQNVPRESRNKSRDQSTAAFFLVNKLLFVHAKISRESRGILDCQFPN